MGVNRKELDVLIGAARAAASYSIVNLSGDLTWLENDLPTMRDVRILKPALRMTIFFDKSRTPASLSPVLKQAELLGVELRPYPLGFTPKRKAMLVDRENGESSLYTFQRIAEGHKQLGNAKSQRFRWKEYLDGDDASEIGKAFVSMLETVRPEPLKIGISGVNNVGKSRLVSHLSAQLSTEFEVETISDVFRLPGSGTSGVHNYRMLWTQREHEIAPATSAIRVFDRTVVDNLCFLKMRGEPDGLYGSLAPDIGSHAQAYDLLVHVQRKDGNYTEDTTHVAGPDRSRVNKFLNQFFVDYNLNPRRVEIDFGDFNRSVTEASQQIAAEIRAMVSQRHFAGSALRPVGQKE
jgi:hypothetical protein